MVFDIEMIREVYELYPKKMDAIRKLIDHPLTLAEKILYTHNWGGDAKEIYNRGIFTIYASWKSKSSRTIYCAC